MKKALKRSLSILLAITIIFSSAYIGLSEVDFGSLFAVKAEAASSGTCGNNVTWYLDNSGTLTISGSGDMENYSSALSVPWYSDRESIRKVIITSGITTIGNHAFIHCKKLFSVTIPDTVTYIDEFAFAYCESLTSIIIPDSVMSIGSAAFTHCSSLSSIIIPVGVTNIYSGTFSECKSLTTVTIPGSIKNIAYGSFAVCTNIKTVYYGGSRTQWNAISFGNHTQYLQNANIIFNCKYETYIINVKALNREGKKIAVSGAHVTVYSGAGAVITKKTDSSGKVTFTKKDLFNKGITDANISNCTVSAHLDVGNGLQLCSEYIDSKGVWKGEPLRSNLTLVVDEPRMFYDVSVGFVGKTERERRERWKSIDSVMQDFAGKFAQSTDGHALISSYCLTSYESDVLMYNASDKVLHDVYVFDNPKNNLGADIETALANIEEGYMLFKYGNGYLNANTLCHEAGHAFFGFYDEYCYGLGYDLNGVKNAGNWSNRVGGTIPHPLGPTGNFGLMDYQHDGDIELSSPEDYSYLDGTSFNSNKPELYTKHYYEHQESTEETLIDYLDDLANEKGYSTSYSRYKGIKLFTDYRESQLESVEYSASAFVGYSFNSKFADIYKVSSEKDFNELNIDFSFSDNMLIGSYVSDYETYVFTDSIGSQEISDASVNENDGVSNFFVPVTQEGTFNIYIVENKDGAYLKESYNVSVKKEDNDTYGECFWLTVTYNGLLPFNDGTQEAKVLCVLGIEDKIVEHKLSATFHVTENIMPQGLSWFVVDGDLYETTETISYKGENNTLIYECECTEDGKYFIPLNNSEYFITNTISDICFEKDERYDDMVWVTFNDTIGEEGYYTVYYGYEEDFEPDSMESATSELSTKRIPIYLEIGRKNYIYITYKTVSGKMYVIESPVTYTNTHLDSDNDGIPDYWLDVYYQLKDLEDIAGTDSDEDGLTNLQEYENGTNPMNADTDSDNVYDSIEIANNLNPLKPMTDGETDDYIVTYGIPDLKIRDVYFDDDYIYFDIENTSDSKAMHTVIEVTSGDESVAMWTIDLGSSSSVNFSVERKLISISDGFKIAVDESCFTRDADYTNNIYEYNPVRNVSLSDVSFVKGTSQLLFIASTPDNATDIYRWSVMDGNTGITIDAKSGIVTADCIGKANIKVETLSGLTDDCVVTVIPFEGSGYTDFDCELINDSTELAITGFIGDITDMTIPETIGGYPVSQLNSGCVPSGVCNLNIPSTISNIDTGVFNCETLESITVDANNTVYSSVDGVLYNAEKTSLLKVPRAYSETALTVPDGVVTIEESAFADCSLLAKIEIPESVETIDTTAFKNCNNAAIYCQNNSTAHTFSIANNIPFIANNDNTMVDLSRNVIYTQYQNKAISDIMASSQGLTYSINSKFSGTGVVVDVMKNDELHSQYTLVVSGDTNGDSVCDVLDAAQVARVTNGFDTFEADCYAMAADSNSDGEVDINDYQAIVNQTVA